MKLLDRYILREVARYAGLGLAVFLFILLTPEVLRLSELMARESISVPQILKLFLSILPRALMWAIPLGVLSGLLMGVSRIAADSEVVALQAAGVGPVRLLRPTLVLATLGALLTLATTAWWGPLGAQTARQLQEQLSAGQLSYEVEPRVFDERFPNLILYVEDAEGGAALWKGLFLADLSEPGAPKVTLARTAVAIPDSDRPALLLHLADGATHTYSPNEPQRYSVSTFAESVISIPLPPAGSTLGMRHNADLDMAQLWEASQSGPEWRRARADFHRRLALPAACLIFGLVTLPLGLLAERSGRAMGVVAAVGVAIAYYFIFLIGDRFARQGDLPVGLGVWLANLALLVPAVIFFQSRRRISRGYWKEPFTRFARLFKRRPPRPGRVAVSRSAAHPNGRPAGRLPRTLDLYVLRGALFHFALLLFALLLLFGLFTILEMVDDIAAHNIPWEVVARFLWYLLPQAFYLMAPLALLLGLLVEVALLSKRNELVAIKGAGISLYRIASPVVLLGVALAGLLFWLDYHYLPYANQQQEALRNQIKGRPPQTFFQTDRRWIFGQERRIYHYAFFDPQAQLLAQPDVFELDPTTFTLKRRLVGERAHWNAESKSWVLENGWGRTFEQHQTVDYGAFDTQQFPKLREPPGYFQKEIRESSQMNWWELQAYIVELRQSGFEVTRLVVEWHKKVAFPLVAAIMVLIAFPFGTTLGTRGAVGGLALGIGLGFAYWVLTGFFEALGNVALLPPTLAAWGPNLIFGFAGVYLLLQMDT